MLRQAARRLMTHEVGSRRNPDELASVAASVYEKLSKNMSALIGDIGSRALLRRSVKLTEAKFPCFTGVRAADQAKAS
ncbi:MAG: hypothetical protein C4294_12725 [Nitrospiraceae bacterium]